MRKFSNYYGALSSGERRNLADRLGVSARYISYHLLGSNEKSKRYPSPGLIERICKETGLPVISVLADFFPSISHEIELLVYGTGGGCSGADQSPAADWRTDQSATKGDQDHDQQPVKEVGGQGSGAVTDQSDCRG